MLRTAVNVFTTARIGIDVFAASGEQVAKPTLITANRAGQIGNDVIKMCTGGQRKTFIPV